MIFFRLVVKIVTANGGCQVTEEVACVPMIVKAATKNFLGTVKVCETLTTDA